MKMTEFQRIKGMSVEELAEFLYGVSEGTAKFVSCDDECDSCRGAEEICVPRIIEFLKSEVDDG